MYSECSRDVDLKQLYKKNEVTLFVWMLRITLLQLHKAFKVVLMFQLN